MIPHISPESPKAPLATLYVAVSIVLILVTTAGTILGYLKPSVSELEEARKLNVMLRERVTDFERDAPSREKRLRNDLAATHGKLLECRTAASGFRDRMTLLKRELTAEQQVGAKQRADLEAAEQQALDLRAIMNQDRPTIIATTELRRGDRHTFRTGLTLEFIGVKGDQITFVFDGFKRIGIPLQFLAQVVPLRLDQNLNAFVGIQPLTLLDRQRKIQLNLVQFPVKWNFTPVAK